MKKFQEQLWTYFFTLCIFQRFNNNSLLKIQVYQYFLMDLSTQAYIDRSLLWQQCHNVIQIFGYKTKPKETLKEHLKGELCIIQVSRTSFIKENTWLQFLSILDQDWQLGQGLGVRGYKFIKLILTSSNISSSYYVIRTIVKYIQVIHFQVINPTCLFGKLS